MKSAFALEKLADKFCSKWEKQYPDIWWCFGSSDEFAVLFYISKWSESKDAKPVFKMDRYGNIGVICKNIPFGSYLCYITVPGTNIDVDRCLMQEVKNLRSAGIETIGCCCGHMREQGYIQVAKKDQLQMISLGYKKLNANSNMGKWCFEPKSVFSMK